MAANVYITQELPQLNYTTAEKYGQVIFITNRDWSPMTGSVANKELLANIKTILAPFDPNLDYICPSGSTVIQAIAIMILVERFPKHALRVLRWKQTTGEYLPYVISTGTDGGKNAKGQAGREETPDQDKPTRQVG